MQTFHTPEPITAVIDVALGAVHLIASDRTDTVVTVNPSDRTREADVEAAEKTRIEHDSDGLAVRGHAPSGLGKLVGPSSRSGWVSVVIELPAGSDVEVDAQVGDVRADGRLGEVRVKTNGEIRCDDTGPARLETRAGAVTLGRAGGRVTVVAAGEVRITAVQGEAEVKNLNGRTWIGEVTGELRVRSSNSDITIGRTHGPIEARTANGAISVGEVTGGRINLATGSGQVDVGIHAGTAAWVDAHSRFGRITRDLDDAHGPGDDGATAEIRARTSFGDIAIHRA
ncbi:hypothetical protein ER308_01980 [Egibacter rhizosphaerae]|uniref:DUF4097 domain-containing protein n=1 Tax=Egibacter rhizosphaerae TaxID=1670831 RepID=A0A411YB97_9ACTN|nr:DUF4097 family beta strand repeat-containing protein [Egibacter rhizosphaerae]QBI18455.1 hypothetical protein ER308_01980 [Egibacter rhizosphaerae]